MLIIWCQKVGQPGRISPLKKTKTELQQTKEELQQVSEKMLLTKETLHQINDKYASFLSMVQSNVSDISNCYKYLHVCETDGTLTRKPTVDIEMLVTITRTFTEQISHQVR